VRQLNGEPAVLVTLPDLGGAPFATVHLETRDGAVQVIRVVRDPAKLAPFGPSQYIPTDRADDGREGGAVSARATPRDEAPGARPYRQ
jgi:hypothetical protein